MRRVWLLALLLVPGVAAQSGIIQAEPTDARLFIHLNGFQDAPMTTSPPAEGHVSSEDVGVVQHSQGCVDNPTGGSVGASAEHTQYAFVGTSQVTYDEGVAYSNERRLGYDLELTQNSTPTVRWILESQITGADSAANEVSPIIPRVVVRASLREGASISIADTAYNSGRLIAQGQSEPVDLHPALLGNTGEVTYADVDGKHLFDFNFDLKLLDHLPIDAEEGMNLRIDVFMDIPCGDVQEGEYLMPDFVRTHSSHGYRPHLDLAVENPVRISSIAAQILDEDVVFHAALTSVWGQYDVQSIDDEREPAKVTVRGPGLPEFTLETVEEGSIKYHTHGTWDGGDVQFNWVWYGAVEAAQAGIHQFEISVENDQQNAMAKGAGTFDVGAGIGSYCTADDGQVQCTRAENLADNSNTPGVGLLAPLLLALLWRRR